MLTIERLFRDATAVGISAAMLGLEIGTKLLRPNFIIRRPDVLSCLQVGCTARRE
jgi:hypothetical protein